jgi:cell shape-determining protein MreC
MPIAAILAGAKKLAQKFFSFAETWIGGFIIAFVVAWLWSGWRHDAACEARVSSIEENIKKKTAEEDDRRARALLEAKAEALEEAKKLESENDELKTKLKELEDASHANDGRPGLPADGVRRLNKF